MTTTERAMIADELAKTLLGMPCTCEYTEPDYNDNGVTATQTHQCERCAALARYEASKQSEKPDTAQDVVTVPSEPTEAMLEAAMQREDDEPLSDWGKIRSAPHAEIYKAMLAAAPAQPQAEVTGWLPIETAPKGRKLILGYANKLGNWRTITGRYYLPRTLDCENPDFADEDGYAPEGWYEESEASENILPTDEPPTHWQPLPSPPREIAAAQARGEREITQSGKAC